MRSRPNQAGARRQKHMRKEFVPQLHEGKTILYDGRTGEPFKNPITVGTSYILKLERSRTGRRG